MSDAIREPRVTGASSRVAAHPEVRTAMLDKQRSLIAAGDYVVEGRDIGTVVAPDAPVKVFLTADAGERARRRAAELERRGVSIQQDEVRSAIEQRDMLDSTRSAAPLRQADDAELIDTTQLTADAVADRIVALRAARPGAPSAPMSADAAEGRGDRLSERRQVHARQPPERHARGRHARASPASRATARTCRRSGTA